MPRFGIMLWDYTCLHIGWSVSELIEILCWFIYMDFLTWSCLDRVVRWTVAGLKALSVHRNWRELSMLDYKGRRPQGVLATNTGRLNLIYINCQSFADRDWQSVLLAAMPCHSLQGKKYAKDEFELSSLCTLLTNNQMALIPESVATDVFPKGDKGGYGQTEQSLPFTSDSESPQIPLWFWLCAC